MARKVVLCGFVAALCAGLAGEGAAGASQLLTSIDLNYAYSQDNNDRDVSASTTYNQKYEVKYETALTSSFDFIGAVRLELEDAWNTNEAGSSRVAPTLEMSAKGSQASLNFVAEGVVNSTDAFQESAATDNYANGLSGELLMTPEYWPELRMKYQKRRQFELRTTDQSTDTFELSLVKDVSGLRLALDFNNELNEAILPERSTGRSAGWSGKATYKDVLYGGTEFELAYEIKQSYSEQLLRDVFMSSTELSTQQLKTRLKNSLALTPRLQVGLSWEYQYEQDLLVLDYDHKINNKYQLEARWDLVDSLKLMAEAKRETDLTVNDVGLDDERKVTDTARGGFDLALVEWLRFSGKAEVTSGGTVAGNSGRSVARDVAERYEIIAKNRFGELWDLTLSGTNLRERTNGWETRRESKFKGELKIKYLEVLVQPSYEVTRTTEWEDAIEDPSLETRAREAKLKFEYRLKLLDLFAATLSHEYGVKIDEKLDDVLSFERTLQFNQDTRISVLIAELVRDLRLEGEVDRRASDTEDDADPELIELSYALKLDWKYEGLGLATSFKYNDKGGGFDDLSFNAKAGWRGDRLDVSGEYQFDKVFADLLQEGRKLNLKMSYKF